MRPEADLRSNGRNPWMTVTAPKTFVSNVLLNMPRSNGLAAAVAVASGRIPALLIRTSKCPYCSSTCFAAA